MNLSKYKGKSFADVAEIISKKYKNRDNDPLQMRSFKMEITALRNAQEAVRPVDDNFSMGGVLAQKGMESLEGVGEAFARGLAMPKRFNGGDITLPTIKVTGDDESIAKQPLNIRAVSDKEPTQPDLYSAIRANMAQTAQRMTTDTLPTKDNIVGDIPAYSPTLQAQSTLNKGMFDVQRAMAKMKAAPTSGVNQTTESTLGVEAEPDKERNKSSKDNVFTPMAIGKGIEALGKGLMLAGGYDKFDPNYNPYEQDVRRLMESQGIDTQAIENKLLSQQEAAMANTGNVRSTAVQQALQQGVFAQTSDALANTELQQQQLRNQLASQTANTLNQLGQQRVQAENISTQLNAQSKAGYQQSVVNLLESIGAGGEEITNFKQGILGNEFATKLLEMENVRINPSCLADYQSGKSISGDCIEVMDSTKEDTGVSREELKVEN